MPLIDDRGRLFGRFNIIDATLVLFLLVLLPIVYTASRLIRVPKPEIESVEPATQLAGPGRRIRVHGRNFRPFLKALTKPAGQPFPPLAPGDVLQLGGILLETPTLMEVNLPDLKAGSYDLHLFDTTEEVARLANAFTLTAPALPPPPPPKKPDKQAMIHARIRFSILPELARLVREGDVTATERVVESAGDKAAARPPVATLRRFRVTMESLPPTIDFGGGWGAKLIEAEVDIPVRQNAKGEWEYRQQQVIRVGAAFNFATPEYAMQGIIGEMRVSPVKNGGQSVEDRK